MKTDFAAIRSREGAIAPRNGNERRLFEIWAPVLEHSQFGVIDSFFDIGGDSLRAVQAIAAIEAEFGVSLPPTQIYHTPTIEELARVVDQNSTSALPKEGAHGLFRMRESADGRPSLFCFPGSGGNVSNFFVLSERLRPERGILVVLYSALERNIPPASMEELAASCLASIRSAQPHGPYYLGGHSFGGSVAYEVAQQLCGAGEEVAMLALWEADLNAGDGILPHIGVPRALLNIRDVTLPREMKVAFLFRQMATSLRRHLGRGALDAAPCRQSSTAVLDKIVRFQTSANEIRRNYRVRPYDGRITIYCAAGNHRSGDISYWTRLARRGLEAYAIPGDHHSMMQEPHIATLVEILERGLDEAR